MSRLVYNYNCTRHAPVVNLPRSPRLNDLHNVTLAALLHDFLVDNKLNNWLISACQIMHLHTDLNNSIARSKHTSRIPISCCVNVVEHKVDGRLSLFVT